MRQDHLGGKLDQLRGLLAHGLGVAIAPAVIDPDILTDGPARLLQTLRKRSEAGLRFRVVGLEAHHHADPANALGLLRLRGQRPRVRGHRRSSCAAQQR